MGHPHRLRSPALILEEMERSLELHRTGMFRFTDLALNGDLEHLSQLCDLILARDAAPGPWQGRLMVRPDMERSLLKRMARSGCLRVLLPVDSLSGQVLQAMRKGFDLKQVEVLLEGLQWAGIEVDLSLVVGFPRETPELFQETLENLERLRPRISRLVDVSACELEYGTRLWDDPAIFGIDTNTPDFVERNWRGPFNNTREERERRREQVLARAEALGLR